MVKIDFEKNWNDVLTCGNFHALVKDQMGIEEGNQYYIFLQGNYMGLVEITSCKALYYRQLDEAIAYLTFAKNLSYQKDHQLKHYNYDWMKWNKQRLLLQHLTWIKQSSYWKKMKEQTIRLKKSDRRIGPFRRPDGSGSPPGPLPCRNSENNLIN